MADQRTVIAVVDDDNFMLKAIERVLSAHGFAAQLYPSAEAFLDTGAASAACLVLDIHLGGMSGIELRRRLKAAHPKLPVIFITSACDDLIQTEAMKVGCAAFLRKPFPASSLIGEINKATS